MYSAAILAGGRATRFGGRDKGALLVEGLTIRDRQLAALLAITDDVLLVGADATAGVRHLGELRLVSDIVSDSGPMGGVHAALTVARSDAVFVIACDMPYITAPLIEYLCELAGTADLVVPRTERGYHPLSAVYTRACLEPLARRLAARQLTMRFLLDDVRVRVVTADEIEKFGDRHRLLANVNTPAEYAGLEALQGHKL